MIRAEAKLRKQGPGAGHVESRRLHEQIQQGVVSEQFGPGLFDLSDNYARTETS